MIALPARPPLHNAAGLSGWLLAVASQEPDCLCYLVHLDEPMAHAQHYIGFATGGRAGVERRLHVHRNSIWEPPAEYEGLAFGDRLPGKVIASGRHKGSRFLAAANFYGIQWHLVRLFPGGERVEHELKALRAGNRLCPVCMTHKQRPILLSQFKVPELKGAWV